ncbi:hypothetical protein VNO78_13160 [Psophocarpus tetragonolobus]|uniref:Acid phosphatase/vanadium-dependent haloperoxidase-related protein n=1 Tax=Psophocarpus tetragonolobus TaxID=3891 RepID=A0AAN9XQA9_PSOTE
MLLPHSKFCAIPTCHTSLFTPSLKQRNSLLHHVPCPRKSKASTFRVSSLGNGFFDDIVQIAQNKVLIAAGVSVAIGQLSKPFTSVFLYGKEFDIRAVIQAGGFPSSHSSATVAGATLFGLERGFSDPVFGLAVVYAGLIMYDAQVHTVGNCYNIISMKIPLCGTAGLSGWVRVIVKALKETQGVRREVGIHARTLNKILLQMQANSLHSEDRDRDRDRDNLVNSQSGLPKPLKVDDLEKSLLSQEATSLDPRQANGGLLVKSGSKIEKIEAEEISKVALDGITPLKESIGHTEVEVIAGALLGFLVALAVYSIM